MTNQGQRAAEYAKKIEWDTTVAFEYAYALLTECNMHTEAAALKEAHDKFNAENDLCDAMESDPFYIAR